MTDTTYNRFSYHAPRSPAYPGTVGHVNQGTVPVPEIHLLDFLQRSGWAAIAPHYERVPDAVLFVAAPLRADDRNMALDQISGRDVRDRLHGLQSPLVLDHDRDLHKAIEGLSPEHKDKIRDNVRKLLSGEEG
jgi:hypothetical protein